MDDIGNCITGGRTGQSTRRSVGRGLGCEYLHVGTNDRSRLAFTELLGSESKETLRRPRRNAAHQPYHGQPSGQQHLVS
jgi:hypothetical protein